MTTTGLRMEKAFFEALKPFFVIYQDPDLDRKKIDGMLVGIRIGSLFHSNRNIMVQVTTRIGDWEKRLRFLEAIQKMSVTQTVYIELDCDELTSTIILSAVATLLSLFFDEKAPRHALVHLSEKYGIFDLEQQAEIYKNWLTTTTEGRIIGRLVFWRQKIDAELDEVEGAKGYGFIQPLDRVGPTEAEGGLITFYVSNNNLSAELLKVLQSQDGAIKVSILVTFFDGGKRGDHRRKTAIEVNQFDSKNLPVRPTAKK